MEYNTISDKTENSDFKNDQKNYVPLVINGRSYRIVGKMNSKYNLESNAEQKTGFNNIKNCKEIEENDDVDSYSGDSDFLREDEEDDSNNKSNVKEVEVEAENLGDD